MSAIAIGSSTAVIHLAATAAAGVGAGLAQAPGADAPLLVGIQHAMIISIAHEFGISVGATAAAELLLTFSATMAGRSLTQWAVGWLPGWGNAINATTAAALTEAVGWAAHRHFSGIAARRDAGLGA